jgi:hypothetical protein
MMLLADLETIMIRAKFTGYGHSQTVVQLSDFELDFADHRPISSNPEKANEVEVCECPEGYAGNSCEICASGYKRVHSGFYLGLCEPIRGRN